MGIPIALPVQVPLLMRDKILFNESELVLLKTA